MRYKVTQTETVEYVLEAANEAEALEFMMCTTSRELRALRPDIKTKYNYAIIEKTVMPADFHYDDEIEEIFDDRIQLSLVDNHMDQALAVPDGIDLELPFN